MGGAQRAPSTTPMGICVPAGEHGGVLGRRQTHHAGVIARAILTHAVDRLKLVRCSQHLDLLLQHLDTRRAIGMASDGSVRQLTLDSVWVRQIDLAGNVTAAYVV